VAWKIDIIVLAPPCQCGELNTRQRNFHAYESMSARQLTLHEESYQAKASTLKPAIF
jgi:hypothetical protein